MATRFKTACLITRGLVLTDAKRSPLGRVWQLLSRFTWELPQTFVGWLFSLSRALAGQVDRVDTLGGITFATKLGCGYSMGVSLGTFVDLWAGAWMLGEGEAYILGNQICMHEFGHTKDSQLFGWAYLPVIGLPSLFSAFGRNSGLMVMPKTTSASITASHGMRLAILLRTWLNGSTKVKSLFHSLPAIRQAVSRPAKCFQSVPG